MRTQFGTFAKWLTNQIPDFIRSEIGKAVSEIPPPKDGISGRDGKDGKTGVSVVDAEIAADDHLVFKLSNGKIIDAGELPTTGGTTQAAVHVAGNAWQITVSSTAPSNPQVNDLWLQT